MSQHDLNSLLIWAVDKFKNETITSALILGANVHTQKDMPIRLASKVGHICTVKQLLKAGATPHMLALSAAAYRGHIEVVRLLLEAGAVDTNGEALYSAQRQGYTNICALLDKYNDNLTCKEGLASQDTLNVKQGILELTMGDLQRDYECEVKIIENRS